MKKGNDEEGNMIESNLVCNEWRHRENSLPAPGVRLNREVGQETGRSRGVIMFTFLLTESNNISRHQISAVESGCIT